MNLVFLIAYIAHMLAIAGILFLLLKEARKSPRKLSPGILHSSALALVAGLVMVGTYATAKPDESLDHTKVGIKLIFLLIIITISYFNIKKNKLSKNVWLTLFVLTITNILIATLWR
ncbi:MAG: hypothetical protein QNL72_01275 [Candidatus Planktophila sp.]|jgi:uncharacterized membrane protein YadS